MTQLAVGNKAGPVHQRIGPGLCDGAADRRLVAVKYVLVDGAHQQKMRRGRTGVTHHRRVRPDHGIHVLVGVEPANVHEPPCSRRHAGPEGGSLDVLARFGGSEIGCRSLARDPNPFRRDVEYLGNLPGREIRNREH